MVVNMMLKSRTDSSQKPNSGIYDDVTANRFALKCVWIIIAVVIAIWVLNQLNIFIIGKDVATFSSWSACATFVTCLLVCYFTGIEKPWVKYVIIAFIVLGMGLLGIGFTYQAVVASVFPLLFSMLYASKRLIHYTFCLMVVSAFVVVYAGYFYGLCDANMLLLTTDSMSIHLARGDLMEHMNDNPLYTLALYYATPRCLIYFTMMQVCKSVSEILSGLRGRADSMERLAETDMLTKTYSRGSGERRVEQYIRAAECSGLYCMFDLDDFKKINDTFGHITGDAALKLLVEAVQKHLKSQDIFTRLGGDEFSVLITDVKSMDDADQRIGIIMDEVRKVLVPGMGVQGLTISMGCVFFETEDKLKYPLLYRYSDELLYRVKYSGRNGYELRTYASFEEKKNEKN